MFHGFASRNMAMAELWVFHFLKRLLLNHFPCLLTQAL
uniref:Uncharacterized protein n=1 Tax=Arundo donax TaxID=35708 RepID=A0A0A8YML9_ARUDO